MSEEHAHPLGTAAPTPAPISRRGVSLSDSAVQRLKAMREEQKSPPESGMRISVKGGGCSGLSYHMEWVSGPQERDRVFERDGACIYVESKSLLYLNGSELTYEASFMASMFKLHNPNAKASCGCGESFSV